MSKVLSSRVSVIRPRTIFSIRNIEERRYSIVINERPATIVFIQKVDAVFFKDILDTQYEKTGIWPMITVTDTLDIYRYNRGEAHSSAGIVEEAFDDFEREMNESYLPFFVVSCFAPSEGDRTVIRGQLLSRDVDAYSALFLKRLLELE